ncbi:MAG: transcription-repair coupling factor, partial [Verrucomicrobiota bacterium]|nr:transcription-repair coupling factor [Verrucomicrobiota bacterium]
MQKSSDATDLLSVVASAESIAKKLHLSRSGLSPVAFSHVTEAAQSFLVAVIAREIKKTLWIICPNLHLQETLYESLLNWQPAALFLPEAEFAAVENILPDPEIAAERLAFLSRLERESGPHLIVATRASLDQSAPKRGALLSATLRLKHGDTITMDEAIRSLVDAHYDRVAQVTTRGQFAVRGGILDLYSWQTQLPVRLEFFGDEIESLREFDLDTQTSVRDRQSIDILLHAAEDQSGSIRDYVGKDHVRVAIEPDEKSDAEIQISEGWIEGTTAASSLLSDEPARVPPEDFSGAFQDCDIGEFAVGDFMLVEAKRAQFSARLKEWREANARVVIYFQTEGEIERFREIIGEAALAGVELALGTLTHGFCFPEGNLVVLSAAELFGRFPTHGRRRLQHAERLGRNRAQIDFSELNEGDLVVHLEHGVGRFLQLTSMPSPGNAEQEVLALEFADDAKLYVPLE